MGALPDWCRQKHKHTHAHIVSDIDCHWAVPNVNAYQSTTSDRKSTLSYQTSICLNSKPLNICQTATTNNPPSTNHTLSDRLIKFPHCFLLLPLISSYLPLIPLYLWRFPALMELEAAAGFVCKHILAADVLRFTVSYSLPYHFPPQFLVLLPFSFCTHLVEYVLCRYNKCSHVVT